MNFAYHYPLLSHLRNEVISCYDELKNLKLILMITFEKNLNLMKQPWIIVGYLVLLVLIFNYLDQPLAAYVHQWNLRVRFPFLYIFTFLGEDSLYFILLVLMTFYFRFIKKDPINEARSLFLFLCVFLASIVCTILKIVLGRSRPELWFTMHAYGFYWFKINSLYWSMPSGHATATVSLASGIGSLFPKYYLVCLGLAGMIILTRIVMYHHFLTDVMSAFYLTTLVVGLLASYAKKNKFFGKVIHFK
jgi:membrane-associated phospholipid phosphatase